MNDWQTVLFDQLKDSTLQLGMLLVGVLLLAFLGKTQPSRRTLVLIFAPVPLLILGFFWSWVPTLLRFYSPLLILLLLLDRFLLSTPPRTIQLSRALNRSFSIGQSNLVVLSLVNHHHKAIQGCIRDSIPAALMGKQPPSAWTRNFQLAPFAPQDITYSIIPTQRGEYTFDKIYARYRSHLGLLWITAQGGRPERIKVTPDLRRMRKLRIKASKAQQAGELQKRALGLEGTQFSGLRHYFAGDDIRKMAWQSTARLDMPVVRTFEPEVEQPILVLLDAGRKMAPALDGLSKYDWAVNTALALIGVAVDRRDCVGAGVFSNRILADIPLGSGRNHLNRLLEKLSETHVESTEPDYESVMMTFARRLKRRTLVVVLTDLIDPIASRSLVRSLRCFSSQHLLMIATFSDSTLNEQASQMPDTSYQAYAKGVALDLVALRRKALLTLNRSRQAIVVDAPPASLDESVIRHYLQLKRQGRF